MISPEAMEQARRQLCEKYQLFTYSLERDLLWSNKFFSNKKRRVAAYVRVSTESDGQMGSAEAQKDYFEKLMQGRLDWKFVALYTDEGITGTVLSRRKAFNQMVSDAVAATLI